mgnify:CR=1 FL=1
MCVVYPCNPTPDSTPCLSTSCLPSSDRGVKLFSKERGEGQAMLRGLLLTYSLYNFDLGYVQGMSDLASPIL